MKRYDIIIIGAGISGLSLAHYCVGEGFKPLVLEKDNRAGGTFHTHRFDGEASDFWIELGAHTCYNSYRNLIGILEDRRMLDRLRRREKVPFKMLINNQIKSIPSQINFLELLFSAPRIFSLKKRGQSIESYYSKIVGKRNFRTVFEPFFNAVPSQKANDFPAEILFKKRPRRKDIMKSFTFDGGIQSVADSIVSEQGVEILAGKEVDEVEPGKDGFSVKTTDGAVYESAFLASAIPPTAAAQLLRKAFPDISGLLSKIQVAAIESVGVAVKKDAVSLEPVAGIIPANNSFYSVVSRDTVRHDRFRGFTFHFKPGIMDGEAKLKQIGDLLGVHRDQLNFMAGKDNLLPSIKVGHHRLVNKIDGLLGGGRLLLTGNYFGGIAIEDCVSRSLDEYQRLKKMT
ncbi:MAG: FAD-dependent oxidoreductase [Nitrospirota bacterium]|nr:FAD-dependent oxidoreductase [Nitrospirota bacterium]